MPAEGSSQTRHANAAPPMEQNIYEILDAIPETCWRYVARHELFLHLWERYRHPRAQYRVLDVGCGSGGLLAYLTRHGSVIPTGIDLFLNTLTYCQQRNITAVSAADATALPFQPNMFDFVIAQDVIEHIEDDTGALREIYRVCAPGGLTLILVPAFDFLWSTRDVRLHHVQRYRLDQIARKVQAAGFTLVRSTYTDQALFPILWAAVRLAPRTSEGIADLAVDAPGGSRFLNPILTAISRTEAAIVSRVDMPYGVSAVILARKSFNEVV
jgi:SAM-dependent methyltransferase